LNARAYRLQKQRRHAEAEPLLRRALELDPNFPYALYNLGWSLVAQGRAREALEPLKRTAAMQPRRWEPYQRLSEAYAMLGEADKAAAYARDATYLRTGRRPSASADTRPAPEEKESEPEIAPIVISE
jgi:tetratricopeptide (TPR) repeat protein